METELLKNEPKKKGEEADLLMKKKEVETELLKKKIKKKGEEAELLMKELRRKEEAQNLNR